MRPKDEIVCECLKIEDMGRLLSSDCRFSTTFSTHVPPMTKARRPEKHQERFRVKAE